MSAVNETMLRLGQAPSVIRQTFEYGNRRAAEIGRENVFDFSLGNPSVESPACVNDTIRRLLDETPSVELHGYTSAAGAPATRRAIAEDIGRRFGVKITEKLIYMTCGAAASLTCSLHALCVPGDEVIVFAPFFPEYRVFIEKTGAKAVIVPPSPDFQIDFEALSAALSPRTKAVIVNSPNNPTGAVLTRAVLTRLSEVLRAHEKAVGRPVFLLSDEPYRELVYDPDIDVPYLMTLYDRTLVCYSFSKSLSLPGERIGYIAVCPAMPEAETVFDAICGAGRSLGFVCAPSLLQKTVPSCLGSVSDLDAYRRNRELLFRGLTEAGFSCVPPDGAFYLFVRSPIPDANEFCLRAREFELLLVPSDSFGIPGYVRLAYCVSTEMIERSLPAFRRLAEIYRDVL